MNAPLATPRQFTEVKETTMACVWELQVMCHERNAWVQHGMKSPEPDFHAYMADVLNIDA